MRVSNIISNETINRGFQIESAGDPNAKASSSTATGLGQYLNQSWFGILYKHGPLNIAKRIKFNPSNKKKPYTVPDGGERVILYMCHFLGEGAARKVFRADPNATAVSVCGEAAADANPTIFWVYSNKVRGRAKTCSELRTWASNSMKQRWDHAGRPDWVGKYYPKQEHPEPEPAPVDETADRPPIKLDVHERDDDDAPKVPQVPDEPEAEPVPLPRPRPVKATKPAPSGEVIKGDPRIWWVQYRLKQMHYYAGMLDGGYGGKVAGAVAAFVNDRHEAINPPNSNESFTAILDELEVAMDHAEAEAFVRPVSQARKDATPEVLDEVAPEAKPVKRNFITGLIASGGTMILSIFNGLKDDISGAWDFFFSHKDDIPEGLQDDLQEHAKSFLGQVPVWVWMLGAAAIFLLFAFNSGSGLKHIIDRVKTGER
jgi:hypothetical protein